MDWRFADFEVRSPAIVEFNDPHRTLLSVHTAADWFRGSKIVLKRCIEENGY